MPAAFCTLEVNAPGHICSNPVKLTVNKIGNPAEEQAECNRNDNCVSQLCSVDLVFPAEEPACKHSSDKPAMEGKPAVPHSKYLTRICEVVRCIIKKHMPQPCTCNHCYEHVKHQIVEGIWGKVLYPA